MNLWERFRFRRALKRMTREAHRHDEWAMLAMTNGLRHRPLIERHYDLQARQRATQHRMPTWAWLPAEGDEYRPMTRHELHPDGPRRIREWR